MKASFASVLFAVALAVDQVAAGIAQPNLVARKNNVVCKAVTRTTTITKVTTECHANGDAVIAQAQTTSELVSTMPNGNRCHFFVVKSGSQTISTASMYCVNKPVIQTEAPAPTVVAVTVRPPTTAAGGALSTVQVTSTPAAGGWCKYQAAMSDGKVVSTVGPIQCVL
ncbi:hypothetical protein TWF694_009791 [Orbilia ellipsospora]|uniref:Uncharacterized protein n=1 Tax=Orbilia ellipsospora TaxID=2528407 RepID=A0AAV9XC97_9PEZI